ncbi:MAG: molybdopterin molybdotransferase MoeA [Actinomycetota bacterium]|nr:molybdopterin molybdotransferase MoeA [Actinomycetota bacterium]
MRRSVSEHQAAVQSLLEHGWDGRFDGGERLPLIECLGRVAAEDVVARLNLPPFANSQMDGFAVSSADLAQGATLRAAATIPAGAVPAALRRGEAAPIMTGAMLPPGADAVVPVERAVPAEFPDPKDRSATVTLPAAEAGAYVREAGSDVRAGSLAFAAGVRLTAAHLGLAAALGLTGITVRRKPRVLLVATGDEVVLPGTVLPAGKIYDANSMLLHANLLEAGAEVVPAGLVPDDPAALLRLLREQVSTGRIDLIVTSGGISAGAYEVVKQALDGAVEFCSVAMQPGGPQALGTVEGVPFLGFPGNPISGVVSFEMFLRPALSALAGTPPPRTRLPARLADELASPPGKVQLRRALYVPSAASAGTAGTVAVVGGPASHLLGSLAASNALLQIPADVTALAAGAEVEVWLL